jgi:hypothetical protein
MGKLNDGIEALAEQLGDRLYLEIAQWHLYLKDAKLALVVAERFYALMEEGRVNAAAVLEVLQEVKVSLGRGQIPLLQCLPPGAEGQALEILREFEAER